MLGDQRESCAPDVVHPVDTTRDALTLTGGRGRCRELRDWTCAAAMSEAQTPSASDSEAPTPVPPKTVEGPPGVETPTEKAEEAEMNAAAAAIAAAKAAMMKEGVAEVPAVTGPGAEIKNPEPPQDAPEPPPESLTEEELTLKNVAKACADLAAMLLRDEAGPPGPPTYDDMD